jgi:tetratricopeptide (TPR) repeat protein
VTLARSAAAIGERSANKDPGVSSMLRNLVRLSLLLLGVVILAAPCLAQVEAATQAEQPPAAGQEQPAVTRSPADMSIPELLAEAGQLRAARRYQEAVNVCQLVLQRDPSNVVALRLLGDIFWETRNVEPAKDAWLRVLETQRNDFVANFGLGRLYLAQGVYRQAMSYLQTAEKVVPASPPEIKPQLLIALAQAYHGAGGYQDEALETIQRALQLAPDSFEAQYAMVLLRTQAARRDRRSDAFDQAVVDAERLVRIAADDLRVNGTTPQRVQTLQTAYQAELQVLSAFGEVLYERNPDGRTFSDQLLPGMEKRAAAILSKTVDVMLRLTDLQRTMSHFRILGLAATAVEYDGGTNPRTLLDLGLLQKQTEQWEAAAESFRKVLELDPGNEVARRELETLRRWLPAPATTEPVPLTP